MFAVKVPKNLFCIFVRTTLLSWKILLRRVRLKYKIYLAKGSRVILSSNNVQKYLETV
jgi:hypothetical protein